MKGMEGMKRNKTKSKGRIRKQTATETDTIQKLLRKIDNLSNDSNPIMSIIGGYLRADLEGLIPQETMLRAIQMMDMLYKKVDPQILQFFTGMRVLDEAVPKTLGKKTIDEEKIGGNGAIKGITGTSESGIPDVVAEESPQVL
jgi:hypothetical protein